MNPIIVNGKEVERGSIEIDFSQGFHQSASFVNGTPLDDEELYELDKVLEVELTEAIQNYRRE